MDGHAPTGDHRRLSLHQTRGASAAGEYMSQACVNVSSTGATPATAGGDVRQVYDVKMFLNITTMYVS
jgi:hypothetical protein